MQSDLTCRTTSTPELRTSQVRLDPTLPHHQTRRSLSFSSYAFGFLLLVATVAWIPPHAAHFGRATLPVTVVSGSPISNEHDDSAISRIERRTNSPVDVCFRWAQQSAVVNGTLYLYGGQATASQGQTENTWNNNFLSLDLTRDWQISSPSLTGLPQPSGPPNVSLGYLWNSHDSLYLYGGEFSWKPAVSPTPSALWEYRIASQSWTEHGNPETSSGKNAPDDNVPVQRAAEGAGISVPSLGRGFYFGGHLDAYTTPGWSVQVAREYLQSLLEFTFPGYTNNQVDALNNGQKAGTAGNYRNISRGGLQSQAGFTARADGLLIFVPGFGEEGILLALAGGTNETFTQMNTVNVYDIANSTWYTQSTSGPTPNLRVNPCAVVAAAPDGSSYNIAMFGGQNLLPYGNQTQLDDMWILSVPSFTWIEVDQSGQSVPYGRSGATCNIWDGQMIMVGGYVGDQLGCETPGIYVFDCSQLKWVNQFTAMSSSSSSSPDQNPFNQQPAQLYNATNPGGLEGSYGYQVPDAVVAVIGGGKTGGATATAPVATAPAGPLATGKPITYTVTSSGSSPSTTVPGNTSPSAGGNGGDNGGTASNGKTSNGARIAAIVVGIVAGLLLIIACYLAFCAYVYRKQLQLYKNHVAVAQRHTHGEKGPAMIGLASANHDSISNPFAGPHDRSESHLASTARSSNAVIRQSGSGSQSQSSSRRPGGGYQNVRRSSENSGTDDLLAGHEPTFVGVMLHPRTSLRVINRD